MGGLNRNLFLAIVAAAVGSGFQHGYHTGVINVPQAILKDWIRTLWEDRLNSDLSDSTINVLWGVTTSIMNVGGTIGGVLSGLAATKFGPKSALFYNNFLVLIASALMCFAQLANSYAMMILGRLVIGVNCGFNAGLCPMYLTEISPVELRGALGSVYQLLIVISILTSQIVGLEMILGNDYWPVLFALSVVFAIFQVVTIFFCPESPKYLISVKQDNQSAEKSLKFLRRSDDVNDELSALKKEDEANKNMPKVTIKQMFRDKSLKIPLFIAMLVMVAQQFSGINIVIFYSTETFIRGGLSEENAQYATIGIGIVNLIMTVISMILVEIAGRKTLLLVAFGGMAIDTLLLALALHFSKENSSIPWVCIALIAIYIILFAAGAGSIPWFLVTEIFNQEARPTAVSLAVPVNWIANFIVTLTFPPIAGLIGPFVFLIFVVLNVLFFIFILKMVPETKNKTVEEIVSQWKE
ncbi:facilitated glucose transporter protein 1 [Tribolium castaneum]|uniref:Glucose transporter type 1-like Protein n=1 Tax=Tribolium castaneum TaxID=7070 RepID=D6WL89_TRICA|nr:PREDICTED: facilitated glucose transporter protein 1 [Tribolium castaneum]EFA04079.1 Glucose transporter type 1-like Protein [Tribolium castaneum]|eukprot:XP_973941.1 PREDICTED: facilitated glucose transporter protein 1 [Tribolium castaneum]